MAYRPSLPVSDPCGHFLESFVMDSEEGGRRPRIDHLLVCRVNGIPAVAFVHFEHRPNGLNFSAVRPRASPTRSKLHECALCQDCWYCFGLGW